MRALIAIAMLIVSPARADVIGLWFAPNDDCTAAIVAEFDKATKSISYQMYGFTSRPIADSLIRAHRRGVKVSMLLDSEAPRQRGSQALACKAAGIEVRVDAKHPISHNKVRIIDGKRLLSGSFNDSKQANRNAENLYLEDDPAVVKRFADNFALHLAHAVKL